MSVTVAIGDGVPVELLTVPFALPPEGQALAVVIANLINV